MDRQGMNVPVGFHSHANNQNAGEKAMAAINHGCNGIDSCIGGLGRGAGNLKSEELMALLHKHDINAYIGRVSPLVVHFDRYIMSKQKYLELRMSLPHPYYMISGVLSLHPDYAEQLISNVDSEPVDDIRVMLLGVIRMHA